MSTGGWEQLQAAKLRLVTTEDPKFHLEIYELETGRQRVGKLVDLITNLSVFTAQMTLRMPTALKSEVRKLAVEGELVWVRNEKVRTYRFVLRRYA
jgi:hypothetical protein